MVLPFANESGVAGLEWMRAGLPVALAEKLEAHPGLRPAYGPTVLPDEPDGPEAAPADERAEVERAAAAAGARFVFTGAYSRPEWKLELTLRLWQVDGAEARQICERTARGDFSESFALLDRLSLELLAAARRPVPGALAERVRRAPTRDFYAFTLYGRGVASLVGIGTRRDLAKAEKDLARSVFIDPKFAEAHRMLALVHERNGQHARARGQRTYALDLRPDYYTPLAGLVRSSHETKDRAEGIALAERALAIRPWDLEVRFLLGDMLWEEGRVDDAYRELERLVAVQPEHLAARRVLVLVHATRGSSEQLATELERIIALDPSDEAARLDLAAAYHALGRDGDAISVYETVAEDNPKQVLALKLLGDLHRQRGDLAGAIAYYERANAANRNDPRPYFLLGSAYLEAGQERKAMRIYLRAQRFPRYLAEVYNNLGAITYRKDPAGALWYLSRAARWRPSNARVHYNYGLALSHAHKNDKALSELTLASQLDPADVDIHFALGAALLKSGRLEDAERSFRECVRLDPGHEDAAHNLRLIEELRRRAREGEIAGE